MSQCHSVCTFTHRVMMSHADKNTGAVALDYLHRSGKMKMEIIRVTERIFLENSTGGLSVSIMNNQGRVDLRWPWMVRGVLGKV